MGSVHWEGGEDGALHTCTPPPHLCRDSADSKALAKAVAKITPFSFPHLHGPPPSPAHSESTESKAMAKAVAKMADDIVEGFQKQMSEVMENLEAGEMAFDDLNGRCEQCGGECGSVEGGTRWWRTWRRGRWPLTTSMVGVNGVEVWRSEVMERLDAGEMAFDDLKGMFEGCGEMGSEKPLSLLPPGLSPLCNGSEGINLIRLHPPSHPPPSQCVALPPSPPPSAPLAALLDGSEGFDMTRGVWRKTGWKELKDLRKVCGVGQRGRGGGGEIEPGGAGAPEHPGRERARVQHHPLFHTLSDLPISRSPRPCQVLEDCVELRDLVRQLGRGGGKGPLRRAPEEVRGVTQGRGVSVERCAAAILLGPPALLRWDRSPWGERRSAPLSPPYPALVRTASKSSAPSYPPPHPCVRTVSNPSAPCHPPPSTLLCAAAYPWCPTRRHPVAAAARGGERERGG